MKAFPFSTSNLNEHQVLISISFAQKQRRMSASVGFIDVGEYNYRYTWHVLHDITEKNKDS